MSWHADAQVHGSWQDRPTHELCHQRLPGGAVPTIFSAVSIRAEGKQALLILCDTAEQEDSDQTENYDHLRPGSYPGSDVFLICFSVTLFRNVKKEWTSELRKHTLNVPHFVGTQTDPLR